MPFPRLRRQTLLPLLLLALFTAGVLRSAVAEDKKTKEAVPALTVHPKVFSLVQGWLSDGESPVVTEVNLDAIAASGNQFDPSAVKQADGWTRCPQADGGFLRYRVVTAKGPRYTVEFQENGGGSLTTSAIIECAVEKREIRQEGKVTMVRVLRVLSYQSK